MATNKIITQSSNHSHLALFAPGSRDAYECANSSITRGISASPDTLDQCFTEFPSVARIAQNLNFITGVCAGVCGGISYSYDVWTGASTPTQSIEEIFEPIDIYLNEPSKECDEINSNLGLDWLGCLWGTPGIAFSCTCPDIGPNFHNYLKLRLNAVTFWNTPKSAPVKRQEFLDAIKYGKKADVTVAGDFNLKIGQVVSLNVNAVSGYPYASGNSVLNEEYYIIGVKHVITNSGTHETYLSLSKVPENSFSGSYSDNYI
jgi:hypothetical protein